MYASNSKWLYAKLPKDRTGVRCEECGRRVRLDAPRQSVFQGKDETVVICGKCQSKTDALSFHGEQV